MKKKDRKKPNKSSMFSTGDMLGGSRSAGEARGPKATNPFGPVANQVNPFTNPMAGSGAVRPTGKQSGKNTAPTRMRKTGP